jgi:hypothetical protein
MHKARKQLLNNVILTLREAFWNNGCEGESVHKLCDLSEEVQQDLDKAEKKLWACPMCGRDRRDSEKECCNPKCKGIWGTGCYCCHHQKYLKDAFEELQEELEEIKKEI